MKLGFNIFQCLIWLIIANSLLVLLSCQNSTLTSQATNDSAAKYTDFPNVLDFKGLPDSTTDRSVFMFSDQGAWHGYSLPDPANRQYSGSFIGPFLLTQDNGVWLGKSLNQLSIQVAGEMLDLTTAEVLESNAYPGRLKQVLRFSAPSLSLTTELVFPTNRTALIRLEIENNSSETLPEVTVGLAGDIMLDNAQLSPANDGVHLSFTGQSTQGWIGFSDSVSIEIDGARKNLSFRYSPRQILPGKTATFLTTHSFCFSKTELAQEKQQLHSIFSDPQTTFDENAQYWNNQLRSLSSTLAPDYQQDIEQRIAVKCLQTLAINRRSPAGFLKHDGLFPSYNYEWFNGFWSWDSWKHAVALALYDTDLAQNQIRAMYDYQDDMGMIADCVYRDTMIERFNWRDTKPPLSAWAIWKVFEHSGDTSFLAELLPKVEKYHQWWYQYRDHDQNGLCEYGSTDGTLIAAKWESGMDNAVRFDETKIVQNNQYGWSMNRESVDLNAYLFAEKQYLAKIETRLGNTVKSEQYAKDALRLQQQIQTIFYDENTGWFYDIDLDTKQQLKILGAEGWIPLWTKAATSEQAAKARLTMIDTTKFATYIPFPTLAADHPKFKPNRGYWRGPIWLDQAYFAIKGLKNYGYQEDAKRFTRHLLERLEGLQQDAPIRENYHPLTGAGMESSHFSWSAAHLLMLLTED